MSVKVNYVDDVPTVEFKGLSKSRLEPVNDRKFYENNTYIDWTSESTIVSSNVSITSKKWLTLIVSALLVGYITTFIDLISVWLNDLKKGLCFSRIDKWSLLNPYLTCPTDDWYNWLRILFNSNSKISTIFVNLPIYFLIALVLTIIASIVSIKYNTLIKQSGIPEIKLIISGFNYDLKNYLGVKTLFFKTFGLILVVASGFWLGKEGPLVHVSCCLLNLMYRMLFTEYGDGDHEGLRRELLSAAVATGISVAFNSPIGGVLFVLECIPCYFMPTKIMWNSFVSATIAVVVLTGFKIFTEGQNFYEQDLFQVNFGNFSWLFMEIIPFIFLGCLGGWYGYLFTKVNLKVSSKEWKQKVHRQLSQWFKCSETTSKYLEIVLVLVLTTLLNFPLEITRLPLGAYLKLLFTDCPKADPNSEISNSSNFLCSTSNGVTVIKLFYVLVQGFFLSSYTFGLPLPGGVLMPSLVLGATTGRLVGILSQLLQQKFNFDYLSTCTENSCLVSPSSYAVVGAGAFMAGITKLTMSVVVIIFELTGAVTYVLPIMLAAIALKFVNDKLCNENIYDSWLKTNFNKDEDYSDVYVSTKSEVNHGKGDGLCDFTNLTSAIKTKLPNVSVEKAMVSIDNTKCFSLFPEEAAHNAYNILSYMADDNHEGYPLITNKQNPISLGYITKQELYSKLLGVDNQHSPISFQLDQLPNSVVSQQLQYESNLPTDFVRISIKAEQPFIIVNNYTPLVLVLEIFEKLSLNYLIVMNSDAKKNLLMSGFVDRFILSRLINSRFLSLQEYSDIQNSAVDEFDIDELMESDQLVDLRRERYSIELIT